MNRFIYQKQPRRISKPLVSICVFLLLFLLFLQGIASVSTNIKKHRRENLENTLTRSITACDTFEGSCPQSLRYLQERYGFTYEEDLFSIDYRISGSNILPEVTIIEKED